MTLTLSEVTAKLVARGWHKCDPDRQDITTISKGPGHQWPGRWCIDAPERSPVSLTITPPGRDFHTLILSFHPDTTHLTSALVCENLAGFCLAIWKTDQLPSALEPMLAALDVIADQHNHLLKSEAELTQHAFAAAIAPVLPKGMAISEEIK